MGDCSVLQAKPAHTQQQYCLPDGAHTSSVAHPCCYLTRPWGLDSREVGRVGLGVGPPEVASERFMLIQSPCPPWLELCSCPSSLSYSWTSETLNISSSCFICVFTILLTIFPKSTLLGHSVSDTIIHKIRPRACIST